MPVLKFEGEACTLMTPELAGMARKAERRDTILAAMDFLLICF